MRNFKNTLLQITQNGMGTGSDELGAQLVVNYLTLLNEQGLLPKFIALYNGGVKLICSNSPAIDIFKTIENAGTKIIACKTCLNHFGVLNDVAVGTPGTMKDIVELQVIADKVVNL